MATHINETFNPTFEVTSEHVTFAPGITALNEMVAKNLADDGDAWLLGMPCYGAFNYDLKMTTGDEIYALSVFKTTDAVQPAPFTSEDRTFATELLERGRKMLAESYALATDILNNAGIKYYKGGNAGLFIWMDLSPFLGTPTKEKDGWALEKDLNTRLSKAGVLMSSGAPYHNETPGWFRLVFSREKDLVEEGLRRVIEVVKDMKNTSSGVMRLDLEFEV
ncbi:putative 1-aminocyclopropane-1-carboxylate synthase-like protein 2 [Glarea lozoyensis 74030]|uniref:Putative 1-aminocyclopropane-1-carboxylate synthase-like protein 2 n=1 Tax=Glarea lozoyensis (strain ATCC 74030 / MF5533) TaxID=1104152 RepID=H0EZE7_GLAL7|nr:putative 1-aminocyclopropane-1-carboxylate synthase-like protein 2 [Glarea lozoyensis 74030]